MVNYEKAGDSNDRSIGIGKGERARGVVKFLRDVFEGMKDEEKGRESEWGFGTVEWNKSNIYTFIEYGFEEKSASPTATFKFTPAANVRQGGTTRQGTDIQDLGGDVAEIGEFIESISDLPLEFAELNAASQGHTNLTNYEFEYETAVENARLDKLKFEEVLNSIDRQ